MNKEETALSYDNARLRGEGAEWKGRAERAEADAAALRLVMQEQRAIFERHALSGERSLIDRTLERYSSGAVLLAELASLRSALQRYVDGDGCEYSDDADVCPGDPPYVAECRWHEARRLLDACEGRKG